MAKKEIDFIAKRYRKGRFDIKAGWTRLSVAPMSRWKIYRVAAAVAATIVISATAAILYMDYKAADSTQPTVEPQAISPLTEVKVIDFENAPLGDVVESIESVYNVHVENMPGQDEEYTLSLHYEGNPMELIEIINGILGTQMTVAEK